MVVVLGGGVGGLSAAYYLIKNGKQNVVLSEASNYLGGWVKSIKNEKTGVLFEVGPRTIRPSGIQGINTLALIEDLNLNDKVKAIKSSHPAAKNRFIYIDKKLYALPTSIKGILRKTPPFSKALIFNFIKEIFTPAKICEDDSIYNFVERRFGKELADYIVSAMICGICAGDSKEISVKFLFSTFFEAEQKYGSVLKGMYKTGFFRNKSTEQKIESTNLSNKAKQERWSVWMLDGGLQTLPDALTSHVKEKGAEVMLNSPCTHLKFGNNEVSCKVGNKELHTDHVISSLPANTLAPLLREQHRILADELASINFVTVGVVNLVFNGNVLKLDGFGFLVPPSQELPILGVIFDSCCYSLNNDKTTLTVMMGGKWFNKYFGSNPKEEFLLTTAISQVKGILDINQKPEAHNVVILRDCIPQYVIGHYKRIDRIFNYIKDNRLPLSLSGSSYHGVGLNDVILSSRKAVNNFLKITSS
ncbi:protoporphyrinogen oxidase [Lycorma delicatula]|uniref:protoporphyrinogen oxidase n=1 Tax=Lycorma delicatula TaxID=130591 RepID=UPI003F51790F